MAHLLGTRLPIDDNLPSRVLADRQPCIIRHPASESLISPALREQLQGIETAIVLPLQVGESAVGVMNIAYAAPHSFDEGEVRLLTAIADMAASAMRRAGLFEQLEHRVHELSALFDVGKMVTATLRIEDVQEFVVRAATQAVHAEGCFLFLWDEREERLVLRASQGFYAEGVGRMKYRLGEGLAGWVFLERQIVNAPDLAADPRWKREPQHEAPLPSGRAVNALVVPLIVGEKTLGVLGVVNKTADERPPTAVSGQPPALSRSPEQSEGVAEGPVVSFTENDQSLLTALAGQTAVAIENARLYEDVRGLSIAAIRSLATAIDARDPYTRGHSEGVTTLAVQVAREIGWEGADLEMLEFAALLHDVGKIAVPDAVLGKIEPLTADEWTIIRLHPYHSAQIVKPVEPLQRIVAWVYHHQERWDGSGYPDGLKGEFIPLAARIIAVVDAYNAMTTDRPYRKARSVAEALAETKRCAGGQFDPTVAEVFVRLLEQEVEIR
jgi:putative nucleotidyltransferase with HDIG domain